MHFARVAGKAACLRNAYLTQKGCCVRTRLLAAHKAVSKAALPA